VAEDIPLKNFFRIWMMILRNYWEIQDAIVSENAV
jgi:hypothetical protein